MHELKSNMELVGMSPKTLRTLQSRVYRANMRVAIVFAVLSLISFSVLHQVFYMSCTEKLQEYKEHFGTHHELKWDTMEYVPSRCGPHLLSTRLPNAYNVTQIDFEMNFAENVAMEAAIFKCEKLCWNDTECRGWSFRKISDTVGECSMVDHTRKSSMSSFVSGICREDEVVDHSFDNKGHTKDDSEAHDAVHLGMIFDHARIKHAQGFIKSMAFSSTHPFIMHLVLPSTFVPVFEAFCLGLNVSCFYYDYDRCDELIRDIRPFASAELHNAPLCKLYFTELLPESVEHVTFIDNDVITIQDPFPCFDHSALTESDRYIGIGYDMGEACQSNPDLCWPISHEWIVTPGLTCGTSSARATRLQETGRSQFCAKPGDREPFQFNAGIIQFDLKRMRAVDFVGRLFNVTAHTARMMGRVATWGDQEFVANYFRFYPESYRNMHCGCNYQWTGARRAIKCPSQSVYIGHGWTGGTAHQTRDPYSKLFFYWKDCNDGCKSPPLNKWTLTSVKEPGAPEYPIQVIHTRNCPQQSWACDESLSAPIYIHDKIVILSRTANRPLFFFDMRHSVLQQSHRNLEHYVVTDDPNSLKYITGDLVVEIPSRYAEFDAMEPCEVCGASPERGCGNAPFDPTARAEFLECYCKTSYPMNTYFESLHAAVGDAWIVYLDDDNLLMDPHGLAFALASAHSTSDLLLWRAKLGRIVPLEKNFGAKAVVRGDCDSANFMFHSSHRDLTRWGDTRCGDFRTLSSLAQILHLRWVNKTVIAANPMRQALGGLGLRGESGLKVTMVITACTTDGFRPFWLQRTINQYMSAEYKSIVDRVIIVWNSPTLPPPKVPEGVVVLVMKKNSLNNRWTKISEHMRTEVLVNLDDDIFVNKAALICLMNWWSLHPTQLIGPFVRKNDGTKYVIDELFGHKYYTLMLPRVIMMSRMHLHTYRSINPDIRSYVDDQEAHCDDLVLNIAVASETKKPPFRVLLPVGSVTDYYSVCWQDFKEETAGLGLQDKRAQLRSECMSWILNKFADDTLIASNDVGACDAMGSRLRPQDAKTEDASNWHAMTSNHVVTDICIANNDVPKI
eukprot:m.203315 g.203315  ORF g.203315 m.203315 type:complete len:1072 (-) comp32852_c6_seq4:36-3251(-)